MRLRLAPRILLIARLILLCAVLVAGLPVTVSTASDRFPRVEAEQGQRHQNSIQASASEADDPSFWVYLPLVMNHYGPGVLGRVTYKGSPAAGIALNLYFNNGTAWSTVAATTTSADGFYIFPPPPSLAAGRCTE